MSELKLRLPSEIPLKFRHIFAQYETFNKVQSKVIDKVLYSDVPIVISAPTGSGKTAIFELAILRLLMRIEELRYDGDYKIVYVAPVKALCMEKFADWESKFGSIGLKCLEATGDSEIGDFSRLMSSQLVVTTPEKWDSLTRKWKDAEGVLEAVKLFMIDEVHLVNEDVRGPILEAIVSRMKTIQYSMQRKGSSGDFWLRLIAVSATIPNIEDLADWLGEEKQASFYQISENMRPVQLRRHVIGFNTSAQGFRFDMNLNYKLASVIQKYSGDKPTLIFCSSRKSVEMATKVLADNHGLISLSDMHKIELQTISRSIQDAKLKQFLIKGIAYHHAGLSYQDRTAIEDAFRKSIILILVCTNTLAMGVNFPAHLVIIKSTENYVCGKSREYTESAILQMIGRAGRPQYDKNGVAVIMTQQKNVGKYENLMNGCTPVESHLHKHLAEHLNSEIVLQTVTDLSVAMKWIRSTFLYVRAVKSPVNYGFAHGMPRDAVEKKLQEICIAHIEALEQCGLIVKDQTIGLSMASTSIGRLMARFYVSFDTMKTFRQIQGNESLLDTFNKVIRSKEFSEFTLRVNDKKLLNAINNHPIRFPVKGKIKTSENKISCLIQAVFDNVLIQDPSMMQEALRMIRLGEKLSKCFSEFIRLSENYLCGKIYRALSNSTIVSKCFKAKLWNNTQYVSKQLKNIGPVYSSLLFNAGKTTIQSILETEARKIEMILGKAPPFGDQILESLSTFPKYSLELTRTGHNFLQVTVKQVNPQYVYEGLNAILIVGDADNNLLFYNCKVDQIICEEGFMEKVFPIKNEQTIYVQAKLIHESLVGLDQDEKIILNPEDEVIETKRSSTKKVQTKIKLKAAKTKTVPLEAVSETTYEYAFGEGDDYFDNIIGAEVDPRSNKIQSELEAKLLARSIDEFPPDAEESNISVKRRLECFHSVPKSKIAKSVQAPKEAGNPIKSFDDLTEIEECHTQNDVTVQDVDSEMLQELFENELQMENDFIYSQVQNYAAAGNCSQLECSANLPLDLRITKNHSEAQKTIARELCSEQTYSAATEESGFVNQQINSNGDVALDPSNVFYDSKQLCEENKQVVVNGTHIGELHTENNITRFPDTDLENHSATFCKKLRDIFKSTAEECKSINRPQAIDNISNVKSYSNVYSENFSQELHCQKGHDNNEALPDLNISQSTSGYHSDSTSKEHPCIESHKDMLDVKSPESLNKVENISKPDVFKRPDFAKLRGLSKTGGKRQYLSYTPQPINASMYTDYHSRLSKSCFFVKKPPKSCQGVSGIDTISNSLSNTPGNRVKDKKTICTLAPNHPTIFNPPRRTPNYFQRLSSAPIFPSLFENYVAKDEIDINRLVFLRKLEEELCADDADLLSTKNAKIQNFFETGKPNTNKKSSLSNLVKQEDFKGQVADIIKYRAFSSHKPIFSKTLPIKREPRATALAQCRYPSNPENDRIDAILQSVGQEPINQFSETINNPFRMKLPRRHQPMRGSSRPKPNFEFFENFRRRSQLEKLNNTLKDTSIRSKNYASQMSRIMFADCQASEAKAQGARLNTASLPKPDIEVFERHARKSNSQFRADGSESKLFPFDIFENIESNLDTNFNMVPFGGVRFIDPNILENRANTSMNFPPHQIVESQQDFFGNRKHSIDPTWSSSSSISIGMQKKFGVLGPDSAFGIKDEPISPSFEALSLLDIERMENSSLGCNPVKMEVTHENPEDVIDLTSTMSDIFSDFLSQSTIGFGDDMGGDQLSTQVFEAADKYRSLAN